MDSSSSGRSLTSFGRNQLDEPTASTESPPAVPHDHHSDGAGHFVPTALDFAYRAFDAEHALKLSVPPVFSNAQAVDSASFAGQGASFAVYRRRIPPQKVLETTSVLGGWSVMIKDYRKLPDVVAYKVALIEFSAGGEPTESSRHAMDAAIMELYLSAHRPILQHPNLVDFLGLAWGTNPFDVSQKLPVLIVEFAEHGNLHQLQQQEYLSIELRRRLCLNICQGLECLHECGIVHGDIKAENVLIFTDSDNKYKAKLSDFGYSVVLDASRKTLSLGGTRPWKAPEAKTPVNTLDAKYTDLYSLALLIWCTFAHGNNIFKCLIEPSKRAEEFFAEVETLKESGKLLSRLDLSFWYKSTLRFSAFGDNSAKHLPEQLVSLQQQLQEVSTQPHDPSGIISAIEETMCMLPTAYFPGIASIIHQFLGTVDRSGLYAGMQKAVALGLSKEPSRRSLSEMMAHLGRGEPATEQRCEILLSVLLFSPDLSSANPSNLLRSDLNVSATFVARRS